MKLLRAAWESLRLEAAWRVASYEAEEMNPLFDLDAVIARGLAQDLVEMQHLAARLDWRANEVLRVAADEKRVALRTKVTTTAAVASLGEDSDEYRLLIESYLDPEDHESVGALSLKGSTPSTDATTRRPLQLYGPAERVDRPLAA